MTRTDETSDDTSTLSSQEMERTTVVAAVGIRDSPDTTTGATLSSSTALPDMTSTAPATNSTMGAEEPMGRVLGFRSLAEAVMVLTAVGTVTLVILAAFVYLSYRLCLKCCGGGCCACCQREQANNNNNANAPDNNRPANDLVGQDRPEPEGAEEETDLGGQAQQLPPGALKTAHSNLAKVRRHRVPQMGVGGATGQGPSGRGGARGRAPIGRGQAQPAPGDQNMPARGPVNYRPAGAAYYSPTLDRPGRVRNLSDILLEEGLAKVYQ